MLRFAVFLCLVGVFAHDQAQYRPRPATSQDPCPPLAIPHALYDPPIAGIQYIADGGRISVSCEAGYENHGSSWVVCNRGKWVQAAWAGTTANPQCLASCEPPKIVNAMFTPAIAGKGLTRHGTKVSVACNDGYEFVGETTISCDHGEWTGVAGGSCFMGNESFCRNERVLPMVSGILETYKDDPLKASEAINYYLIQFLGIRSDGLGFIGLNPVTNPKRFDRLVYYIPGLTGSDAVFRSVVLPGSWNMTALPNHFSAQDTFCRVFDEKADTTAYIFKVLYRKGWGSFSFQKK